MNAPSIHETVKTIPPLAKNKNHVHTIRRTSKGCWLYFDHRLGRVPGLGLDFDRAAAAFERVLGRFLSQAVWFRSLGFKIWGPNAEMNLVADPAERRRKPGNQPVHSAFGLRVCAGSAAFNVCWQGSTEMALESLSRKMQD